MNSSIRVRINTVKTAKKFGSTYEAIYCGDDWIDYVKTKVIFEMSDININSEKELELFLKHQTRFRCLKRIWSYNGFGKDLGYESVQGRYSRFHLNGHYNSSFDFMYSEERKSLNNMIPFSQTPNSSYIFFNGSWIRTKI